LKQKRERERERERELAPISRKEFIGFGLLNFLDDEFS